MPGHGGDRELVANFNNWKKLDPRTLRVWCAVLRGREEASLWLMNMLPYTGPEVASLPLPCCGLRLAKPPPLRLHVRRAHDVKPASDQGSLLSLFAPARHVVS